MLNLNDIINEFLDVTKEQPKPKEPLLRKFFNRKDILKQRMDEAEYINQRIQRDAKRADEFLNSVYYKEIVEPFIKNTVKSGIQRLLQNGEELTETQLKTEIANIKTALRLFANIKLKIIIAEKERSRNENKL